VKTGSDQDAASVDLTPREASLVDLIHFPRPSVLPHRHRVGSHERQVYKLTDVWLLKYKQETDGDYHLVLSDGDWTMIAEIPVPDCVPSGSLFALAIRQTRARFDSKLAPEDRFQRARIHVTVTGVGFFDFLHDQGGVAPNGFELHPLLDLCFGSGCRLAEPIRASEAPALACSCASGHPAVPELWLTAIACLRWLAARRHRDRIG
jgi:hypothetical protein